MTGLASGSGERGWAATNRAWWDERTPIHVASPFYDVEGWLAGGSDSLRPFAVAELGDGAGEVVSAIASAVFRIELLHEHDHDHTLDPAFPFLEVDHDGTDRLPQGEPTLPMMYSLRAVRDRS